MDLIVINNLTDNFWNWFGENEFLFRKIFDDRESDLIDGILTRLLEIQTGLAVEFEKSEDIYLMTISADGIEEYFDFVQKIILKAPQIPKWKFFALRQPYNKEKLQHFVLTFKGHNLDPKRIMFLPIVEDEKLYIQIFSSDINENTKNNIGHGCLMLLDNIIGEYDCVKKVDGYEYYNLSEATEFESDLRPLTEVAEFLYSYYQDE
jgi:hypothetical protein